jgi:general secretion pathway protein A
MTVELLEEIRLLGNTDTYHEKLLQIVLCGQPELFAVLQRPELQALQQRIAGTCLLRPLSLPETRAYVAERLHAAGLRGSSPFTGTAVEAIHKLSNGVPRLINLLSDACLMAGFELKRKQVDQLIVNQAAEDVLGLVKPATTMATASTALEPEVQDLAAKAPEPQVEEPVAGSSSASVSWSAPAQASAESFGAAASSPSVQTATAVAVAEPEEPRPAAKTSGKAGRSDNRPTKSTFDVLIAALKQNRAVARD